MRVLIFKESDDDLRLGDRFLCPSCNNSLVSIIAEDLYQCDDMYCSKTHYTWEMNVIARELNF